MSFKQGDHVYKFMITAHQNISKTGNLRYEVHYIKYS